MFATRLPRHFVQVLTPRRVLTTPVTIPTSVDRPTLTLVGVSDIIGKSLSSYVS